MKLFVATSLILFMNISAAAGTVYTEEQKIAMLISHIRGMRAAVFIRNGKEYPPEKAAEHLEMKYNKVKGRIKTARLFIDHIASKSYFSGKYYMIRFPDGRLVKSIDVLNMRLKEIESEK